MVYVSLIFLKRKSGLHLHKSAAPFPGHRLGYPRSKAVGRDILCVRIGEDAGMIEPDIFCQAAQQLEVFFRFPGESHQEGGPKNRVRRDSADFFEQATECFPGIVAPHFLEDSVASMLSRNVEIPA